VVATVVVEILLRAVLVERLRIKDRAEEDLLVDSRLVDVFPVVTAETLKRN